MAAKLSEVRIGLLGAGQVAGGVAEILAGHAAEIEARLGSRLRVIRALVRDARRDRTGALADVALTTDPDLVLRADDVDVVVELIGGIEPARSLMLRALEAGKPVVTANKALLATHAHEIFSAASRAGVDVHFEAAVCGGVPIIRTLREALASDRIESIRGIVNGTTNYMLSEMESGRSYADALQEAQRLGYAEADPTFDVGGHDAAQKLLLLASLAFGARVSPDDVPTEGIEIVDALDFAYAREFGCTIRLLARAALQAGELVLDVRPALVPAGTLLATTRGAFNAVEMRSTALGPLVLVGQGAGPLPTGTAVVSDIIEVCRNRRVRASGRVPALAWRDATQAPALAARESRRSAWYLRFVVADEPGVLAAIAGALGARGISIASVLQRERAKGAEAVPVVVVTHDAPEGAVRQAVAGLDAMAFSRGRAVLMPFERE